MCSSDLPTRPSSDTYAARDTSSRGYWLVHIVVPPIGLQIPLAPWILSPDPLVDRISLELRQKDGPTRD